MQFVKTYLVPFAMSLFIESEIEGAVSSNTERRGPFYHTVSNIGDLVPSLNFFVLNQSVKVSFIEEHLSYEARPKTTDPH